MNGRATSMLLLVVASACASPNDANAPATDTAATEPRRGLRVLFFQEEGADVRWYHSSTPVAERAMRLRGAERGWEMTTARDSRGVFTPASLERFDVIVYLLASGTVLAPSERDALQSFIAAGKGYAGVHSASFTDPDWAWYIGLVGTRFHSEAPSLCDAVVSTVARPDDVLVSFLPARWARRDQWYKFTTRPEENASLEILLALDEGSLPATYPSEMRMGHHPIAWRQRYGGGRAFYTAMGHTDESWSEEGFLRFVAAGIEWAGADSVAR